LKKEARIGVLVSVNKLYGICVFRGKFLEHLFLGRSKDEVFSKLEISEVIGEIRYSNFDVGKKIDDEDERVLVCKKIIEAIDRKLNI